MLTEETRLDGNAAAGMLREVFVHDATTTMATCAGCGRAAAVGTLLEYGHGMGVVLRCPGCNGAVLRIVRTAESIHVDFTGLTMFMIVAV